MAAANALAFDAAPGLRCGVAFDTTKRQWVRRSIASDNLLPGVRKLTPAEAREVLAHFQRHTAAESNARAMVSTIPGWDRLK